MSFESLNLDVLSQIATYNNNNIIMILQNISTDYKFIFNTQKYLNVKNEYISSIKHLKYILEKFPNTKYISFNCTFNENLDDIDLSNMYIIKFKDCSLYNHTLSGNFKNLNQLYLSYVFNKDINNCNFNNLNILQLSNYFNKSINECSFPKLRILITGASFNKSLDNMNFPNLEYLQFGLKFNKPLNKCNLPKLKYLIFDKNYQQPLDNCNFNNLCELYFRFFPNKYSGSTKLNNLHQIYNDKIVFEFYSNSLFNQTIQFNLPLFNNLTIIVFCKNFNQNIDNIYFNNLNLLKCGDKFNQKLNGNYFPKLKSLYLGKDYTYDIFENKWEELSELFIKSYFVKNIKKKCQEYNIKIIC